MILLIDNYDSFTYNLFQYIGEFDDDIRVYRNDKITSEEVLELNPDKIVISPGPKTPDEAGNCLEIIKDLSGKIPILGICLGHQSIGQAFGGKVVHAKTLFHGKSSDIEHNGEGIFSGVKSPLKIARYHSLVVEKDSIPNCFKILAMTDDGEVMAIEHKDLDVIGLQFHPESIITDEGKKIIKNFVEKE